MLFSVLIRLHLKKKRFEEVKTTRTVVSYLKEVAHQHDTRRYTVWYGHSEGMQKLKSQNYFCVIARLTMDTGACFL